MSLFDSLSAPNLQHKNPQVRKQAVEQLDDEEVLLELLAKDPDEEVQCAALSRIANPATLDTLIDTLPQPLLQQARDQRLNQLMPAADKLVSMDDDGLLRIASLTNDTKPIDTVMSHIESEAVRMDIAASHPLAKVRLNAAMSIENIDLLNKLMLESKGHDKTVYRHCKNLVDEHHAKQREEKEQKEKTLELIEQVEELTTAVDSPGYEHQYRRLVRQWQVVSHAATSGQQMQFQVSQATCAERLVLQADVRAAEEKTRAELAGARKDCLNILEELDQLDKETPIPGDTSEMAGIAERLNDIETRFQAVNKITRADAEQTTVYTAQSDKWRGILKAVQGLKDNQDNLDKVLRKAADVDVSDYLALQDQIKGIKKLTDKLSWPQSLKADLPPEIKKLREALKQLNKQADALEARQTELQKQVQESIKSLDSELEQNNTRAADRALARARKTLSSLNPKTRQKLEQGLKPLAARLREVHDWQGFAIEPKKVELCENMTRLIGSGEDADTLAAKIKALQDEWKQLGALPQQREKVLWQAFKDAADQAWEPCKAVFAQRAALQRSNFEKRMQLVAQLKDYEAKMSWPDTADVVTDELAIEAVDEAEDLTEKQGPPPDWRMVQKTLDTARQAFKNIQPVYPKDDRASYKAFKAICDQIYSHIKQEYARNITLKNNLVTRAQELVSLEDLSQAIESAKKLQAEWKQVGMTPVSADRKNWKAFRAACDAVFARLDEQRIQNRAEMDAQVKQAEALRDQAMALLDSHDEAQAQGLSKTLSELKQQVQRISLPSGLKQRLAKDFVTMEGKARDLAKKIRASQEQACWIQLGEKISACALKSQDEDKAVQLWEKDGDLPKGIDTAALEEFWQHGPASGHDEQTREACIALEIHGEFESPEEDKQARMNYQMKRLVEGMGSRVQDTENFLLDSINQFIALHPGSDWAERYCSCLAKIKR